MQFTTLQLQRQVHLAGCLNFTIKQLEMHFVLTELVLMKSYSHYYRGHHCNLVAPLTTAIFYQRDNFVFKCYLMLNRLEGSISKAMPIARIEAFIKCVVSEEFTNSSFSKLYSGQSNDSEMEYSRGHSLTA